MKRIGFIFLLFTAMLIWPSTTFAADDVNQAYEDGDLVIEPHWERLPWHQNNPNVPWPGEDALDNWYDSDEVWDLGVFEYVYDVYYLGEKVDPDVVWVSSTVPTSTFCTPVWNEETQQFDPKFEEDGTGSFKIWSFSLADNASKKAPIKGSLSEENVATIPTWRLIPYDLTDSNRVRIVYDGTWNNNKDSVLYTGEAYPLTFWSSWEGVDNPMYTVYWKDADDNEILLDKGYDYAGRAMNNIDITADPTNQTTWAKPILLGVYDFQGKYIPENGDFYIKDDTPVIIPKVQVIYKVGNETIKTTEASVEPINLNEQAPQVENLAYWSYQSSIGYNPIVSPIEGQELNLVTVYGVLNGADGQNGATGPQGEQGVQGEIGPQGEQGPQGEPGKDGTDGTNGKDGIDGKDGKDGVDGKDGIDGQDGKNGVDGQDSKDGENGKDGKDGKQGPQGEKGDKGDKGDPGINGKNGINGKDDVTKTVVVSDNPQASTDKLPKTGDSNIIFWIIGIIIAAGICSVIALNKIKN